MNAPERERPAAFTNGGAVSGSPTRYSDLLADWLVELGYTHCFFVAGGNIMHLLDALRVRMTCVPVVHEVAAGIAAEYFNEAGGRGKAFALVTAGPGLTNIVTALAGAWLESRELLVIGGQVKSTDLASGGIRQRGIQEVDGVAHRARRSACARCASKRRSPRREIERHVAAGTAGRKGPVFLEICLDAQGAPVDRARARRRTVRRPPNRLPAAVAAAQARRPPIARPGARAQRPVLLLGGGVSRTAAARSRPLLRDASVAVMATWNGLDRVDARDRELRRRAQHLGPALRERAAAASRPRRRARLAARACSKPVSTTASSRRSRRSCRSTSTKPSCARATRTSSWPLPVTPTRCSTRCSRRIWASTANGSRSAARCARRCRSPIPQTGTIRGTSTRSCSTSRSRR